MEVAQLREQILATIKSYGDGLAAAALEHVFEIEALEMGFNKKVEATLEQHLASVKSLLRDDQLSK